MESARHATGTGLYRRLCLWITLPCHDGQMESQSCPRLDSPGWPLKFIILHDGILPTWAEQSNTQVWRCSKSVFEKVRNGGGGDSMPQVFFLSLDRWSWHNQRHSIRSALPLISLHENVLAYNICNSSSPGWIVWLNSRALYKTSSAVFFFFLLLLQHILRI